MPGAAQALFGAPWDADTMQHWLTLSNAASPINRRWGTARTTVSWWLLAWTAMSASGAGT